MICKPSKIYDLQTLKVELTRPRVYLPLAANITNALCATGGHIMSAGGTLWAPVVTIDLLYGS